MTFEQTETIIVSVVRRATVERGQTMVEYALLVAFIAIIALVGVQLLGTNILGFFTSFANNPL